MKERIYKIDPAAFLQIPKREPKTELTPEGEQFVIPGAERDKVAGPNKPKQGRLWD